MDLVLAVIIGCEIGFWVFVLLGLTARYVLRRPRTGIVLLAMTPVVDLVLLTAVIIHPQAGGASSFFHGLAALYLGVSVAYGHKMVTWADARFAHRFAHGPAPVRRYGSDYAKDTWKDAARTGIAVGIDGEEPRRSEPAPVSLSGRGDHPCVARVSRAQRPTRLAGCGRLDRHPSTLSHARATGRRSP